MNEYTKGESKILGILMSAWVRGWYSGINGDNSDGKKRVDCPEVMGIYAKEFVRRYDAFEEGGIVEELVKACEELVKAENCYASSSETLVKFGSKIRGHCVPLAIAAIAAIAKTKP